MRGDGFGQMLLAAYAFGPARGAHLQVIERDDGFVSIEDAYRYFTQPHEWIEAERRAIEIADGRILDVGCAAGRHMLALQDQHEIIGIDPSPGAVAVAREQGLDVRLGTVEEPGDDLGTFDTILLLGGNLGLLGSREQAPAVLASLSRLAKPGARLLANGHDPYIAELPEHRTYHKQNEEAGRLRGQVRMRVRYRAWTSDWFGRLLLAPSELAELTEGTAWTLDLAAHYSDTGFYLAELIHHP